MNNFIPFDVINFNSIQFNSINFKLGFNQIKTTDESPLNLIEFSVEFD